MFDNTYKQRTQAGIYSATNNWQFRSVDGP